MITSSVNSFSVKVYKALFFALMWIST